MHSILLFLHLTTFAPAPDSIGTKVEEGRKMIIHRVEPRETWYSVSRKYGVPVPALQNANPSVLTLQIGQNIDVPANKQKIRTSTIITNQGPASVSSPVSRTPAPAAAVPQAQASPSVKTHTVSAGETMFSISKRYGVSVAAIKSWNNLGGETVKIGQVLNVSGGNYAGNYTRTSSYSGTPSNTPIDKEKQKRLAEKHIVTSDPWERIERLADGVTEGRPGGYHDTSKKKMGTAPVVAGKKDTAKYKGTVGTPVKPQSYGGVPVPQPKPVVVTPPAKKDSSKMFFDKGEVVPAPVPTSVLMKTRRDSLSQSNRSLKETNERGAASWINDEQVNSTKYYALHRTAPIGTIIKVTNITNNQNVFVKVVGILPDTGDNSNLIIKISKAAAKKLNTTDAKFQAELSYGVAQ